MIPFLLTATLILSYGPVFAEWVAVEKTQYQPADLETIYFDPETIRRDGNRAILWQLTDIKWNDTTRFLSTKTQKEFDCAQFLVRVLQVLEFSRQMGTGRSAAGYIENGRWQAIEAHTLNRALLQIACGKR